MQILTVLGSVLLFCGVIALMAVGAVRRSNPLVIQGSCGGSAQNCVCQHKDSCKKNTHRSDANVIAHSK